MTKSSQIALKNFKQQIDWIILEPYIWKMYVCLAIYKQLEHEARQPCSS